MVFLAVERRLPSCGTSQENQTWHHFVGAVGFVAVVAAPAIVAALVAVAQLSVSVAGVVFAAEWMGYNWEDVTGDQQTCENMDVIVGVNAVGVAVNAVGVAAWLYLLVYRASS